MNPELLKHYKETYQTLPQIQSMNMLLHHGYYDGPLSGMCEVDGQKCYFEFLDQWSYSNKWPEDDEDDFEPPWYRRFLIYRLSDEQLAAVEKRHEKFRRMVGKHSSYINGKREGWFEYTDTITLETVKQYYEEAKHEAPLNLDPVSPDCVLGWYER